MREKKINTNYPAVFGKKDAAWQRKSANAIILFTAAANIDQPIINQH